MNSPPEADRRWLTAAALSIGAAAWTLVHAYQGIFHDANLYTLQALARLYPDSLTQDVFLKFGSQDRFTLFSPLYAFGIWLLGVDHAAAILTLLSQAALVLAALSLARAVLPGWAALLGAASVVVAPLYYGPERIFSVIEDFLTPRMVAEALVLASLTAILSARKWLSIGLLGAALLMHPVMAAAGAAAWMALHLNHPRRLRQGLMAAALLLIWILLSAYALPAGTWGRFDAQWHALVVHRSPYLFLSDWELDDWSRAGVVVTTLLLGSIALGGRARLLSLASLITVLTGWLLTLLACDALHLVLWTQLQPWRWQWLGTVVGAMLLPMVLYTQWTRDAAGRITSLLLTAAWIFGVDTFALLACLTCLASLSFFRLKPGELRLIQLGSYALVILAVAWRVASNLQFTDAHYMSAVLPQSLRQTMSFMRDGSGGILVVGALALIGRSALRRTVSQVTLVAAAAAVIWLLPYSWRAWTATEFTGARQQEIATWRRLIAPGTDVLWTESPISAWVLLNRGSYLSGLQTSGVVFSRAAALELARRAESLKSEVNRDAFLEWRDVGLGLSLSLAQLQGICSQQTVKFLVSSADLGFAPAAELSQGESASRLRLYRCAE